MYVHDKRVQLHRMSARCVCMVAVCQRKDLLDTMFSLRTHLSYLRMAHRWRYWEHENNVRAVPHYIQLQPMRGLVLYGTCRCTPNLYHHSRKRSESTV